MTKDMITLTGAAIMALCLTGGAALADRGGVPNGGVGNGKGQGAATAAENASDKAQGGFGVEDDASDDDDAPDIDIDDNVEGGFGF